MRYLVVKKINCDFTVAAGAACISMLIACFSLGIWQMDLSVLPGIGGDGVLAAFLSKSIQENGWKGVFINTMVGAPDSSSLIDVPFFDYNMIFLIWIINKCTGNYIKTIYVFYILTYGMSAISMFFLLKQLNIKRFVNFVISILFAAAPCHFYRGIGHITLSNYFTIPLGVYLAFVIYENYFSLWEQNGDKKKLRKKSIGMLLLAVLTGTGQLYFSFFSFIAMLMALIIVMLRKGSFKPLRNEGILVYSTCLSMFAGVVPKIMYGVLHGQNQIAGIRVPMEAELYGMKIIELLLPVSYSRIGFLADINTKYATSGVWVSENIMSPLGMAASMAFLILCGWFMYSFLVRKKNKLSGRLDFIAFMIFIFVLFCTVGGFGTLFNFLITPQIRAYNRASILIACFALTGLAVLLNAVTKKTVYSIVCVLLLVTGIYDQVLIHARGWQDPITVLQHDYQQFFEQVEAGLQEHAMVYELPHMNFPEAPAIHNMQDYTPFLGYLFTESVRWSYGGIIGRNDAAKELYIDQGKSQRFLNGIKESGFCGVLIDTYAYEDDGQEMIQYYKKFEYKEIVSNDKRFYFYKI